MIRLANLIARFEDDFLDQYGDTLLPGQRRALSTMKPVAPCQPTPAAGL